jgi:hypothetical protein
MFSSTGADGLSGTVGGALAGVLVSGAPHAMAATSTAARVGVPSSDRVILRIFWLSLGYTRLIRCLTNVWNAYTRAVT